MENQTMLVTEGLNELKLLDSRIKRGIENGNFISSAKTVETKVTPNITKQEFIDKAKADYQSITDLILRRATIKAAIVESNANTMVEINGEKMSVATAIEMKASIEYEKWLMLTLIGQRDKAVSNMNVRNSTLEDDISNKLDVLIGKDGKTKKEDFKDLVDSIRADGEYSLVDPLKVEGIINNLNDKTEGFLNQVDSVLQISNCTTTIKI